MRPGRDSRDRRLWPVARVPRTRVPATRSPLTARSPWPTHWARGRCRARPARGSQCAAIRRGRGGCRAGPRRDASVLLRAAPAKWPRSPGRRTVGTAPTGLQPFLRAAGSNRDEGPIVRRNVRKGIIVVPDASCACCPAPALAGCDAFPPPLRVPSGRAEAPREFAGGQRRVLGAGDGAHHHDAACSRVEDLIEVAEVDAADREPGLTGVQPFRK